MKKIITAAVVLAVFQTCMFSAVVPKKAKPDLKKADAVTKEAGASSAAAEKPAVLKATEILINDFEGKKPDATSATYMGDASGMEETAEDKIIFENTDKKAKTGKQSARLDYTQKPTKNNKFAQLTFSTEKPMGSNNAVSFYIMAEKGKTAITVNLYDTKWKKWVSQSMNADKSEWTLVTIKDSEFVTDAREGKWGNINKMQIIVKGSGIFYFDNIKFVKTGK